MEKPKPIPVSLQIIPEDVQFIDSLAERENLSRHKFMKIALYHFINLYLENPEVIKAGGFEPLVPKIKKPR